MPEAREGKKTANNTTPCFEPKDKRENSYAAEGIGKCFCWFRDNDEVIFKREHQI